jgi:integrase/recombinase XerD
MDNRVITMEQMNSFCQYLRQEERSAATVEKYLRNVRQFAAWLDGAAVCKNAVAQWKEQLLLQNYSPSTVNGKLTALDRFLQFLGWTDRRVRHLRLQRRLFRDDCRELTRAEYLRLISTGSEHAKTLELLRLVS